MMRERPTTLGEALDACRRARGWTEHRMAEGLGLGLDAYRGWQGDADLPDAEGFLRVCLLLDAPPLAVRRLLRASVRVILSDAVEGLGGGSRPVAARSRGAWDGDPVLFAASHLPGALRRALACWAGADAGMPGDVAEVLRSLVGMPPEQQEAVVSGIAASVELEGEEALGLPSLPEEPGWGRP